jgi:hypothetical protein
MFGVEDVTTVLALYLFMLISRLLKCGSDFHQPIRSLTGTVGDSNSIRRMSGSVHGIHRRVRFEGYLIDLRRTHRP